VWKRTVNGRALRFHLAGINNQNFLMRDEETGSWWQQITGKAIFGPLKGEQLEPVLSDELTFGLWKQESPNGQVLAPVAKYAGKYEKRDWETEMQKLPVVISFPGTPIQSRETLIGIEIAGVNRAYPVKTLIAESPVQDRLGGSPIVLVAGPDKKSIRAFVSRVDGVDLEFFRDTVKDSAPDAQKSAGSKTETPKAEPSTSEWSLIDSQGGRWNFRGCAVAGPLLGKCLQPLSAIKDFWFDWRNYHPETTVYQR
jgi:hypothetical protein